MTGPNIDETLHGDGYYDQALDIHLVSVTAGACRWTRADDIAFSTTLGSCLSVCAYDAEAGIGGMNHFLLPEPPKSENEKFTDSFRYGSAAIEQLLNALYNRGAARNGLEIKVFGGGRVLRKITHQDVGLRNIDFTRRFFKRERMRIGREDVGGDYGRRLIFFPRTGKVLMRYIGEKDEIQNIATQEVSLMQKLGNKEVTDDIELF